MDSKRFSVEEVFFQAVQEPPARRQVFLDTACPDARVRTRVEALLKAHDSAGDFLGIPAVPSAETDPLDDEREADGLLDFLDPCDKPGRLGLLAHYEITEVLGRGGMGIVLRGVDVKLSRVVAIKVLAPQLAANATARKRFLREAQAAAAVAHAHVVTIHAVDEFKTLPYLVMECITGPSLQQKIDTGGALQLTQILRIGRQVSLGLAAAHSQGLVHRDIKPANMLLENGVERVKITDFGLARSIDDVRMTQAGMVYGTPQYMSPEQGQGERVDQRSDLFSLGSVMYAMSTGRPPFRGDTGLAVLKRVCEDTPRPIRDLNPEIPEALAGIIGKLLAKNPDARFQTAAEVAELLTRYLAHLQDDPLAPFHMAGQPELKLPPARSRLRRPMRLGAAVVLLGIAGLAALEGTRVTNWTGWASPSQSAANDDTPPTSQPTPGVPGKKAKYPAGATNRPVKVFILAGDATMAGRVQIRLLKYQAGQPETKERFQHLLDDGEWIVREDVWVKNHEQKGNLTVGYGQMPDLLGPELELGNVLGDYFDEQVLLIKCCPSASTPAYAGGESLYGDFRSPSAGVASEAILAQLREELAKTLTEVTPGDVTRRCGNLYRDMLTEVWQTLANIKEHFPNYQGQGYEIAGFVFFQGWHDVANSQLSTDHTELLAHFIRDVRADFKTPNLPFVIGQLGLGGSEPDEKGAKFRIAQAAVAQLPQFAGNVKVVPTDPFWDNEAFAVYKKGWRENYNEWAKLGSDFPFRYLGSAKTNCQVGRAFGEAVLDLRRGRPKN